MPSYTTFKGPSDLNKSTPSEIVCDNLQSWMEWAFLTKGGYTNIDRAQDALFSRLRPVTDPNYSTGQVWEGPRKGWVWESGTGRTPEPIAVSGIEINGTFHFFSASYPNAENKVGGYIDYPNGRVILHSGISATAVVKASYSFRWVNVYKGSDVDIIKTIQYRSYQADSSNYLSSASGDWSTSPETRVQLPAIIIEKAGGSRDPYALGGGHYYRNNYICHVLAENESTASRIGFILGEQEEKSIKGYDTNKIAASSAFPLNLDGSMKSGAVTFEQLVELYPFKQIDIIDANTQPNNQINQNLYQVPVRMRTETILAENY